VSGHSIELQLDSRDGVTAKFVCHEDDHGPCRWICGLECPVWDSECLEHHPRQRVDYCNPLEFVDNDDAYWWEKYVGEETPARSGPIVFVWQSDEWYGWRYAEDGSTPSCQ
jgi:hypothetical protein